MMSDNELERIWQNSSKEEEVKFSESKLIIDLNSKLKSFDRSIKNRDRREIIAAAILIPTFGIAAFFFTSLLSRIGLLLGALYGVFVIFILRKVRKYRADNYSLPVNEYLLKQRQYLIKERTLLDNVLYWYLLPPFVSAVLFFIGQNMDVKWFIISTLIVFFFNAFVYFLNKRTVKNDFDPLIKKIDLTIHNLETVE